MRNKYAISGMTCGACVASVERAVRKVSGVRNVFVSLAGSSMVVDSEEATDLKEIESAVTAVGYGIKPWSVGSDTYTIEVRQMRKRVIISVILMLTEMYLAMGHMFMLPIPSAVSYNSAGNAIAQMIVALVAIVVNFKFFTVGFTRLVKLSPNMDTLVAIGSAVSFAYGVAVFIAGVSSDGMSADFGGKLYFEGATMILSFVTLGKFLEKKATKRTGESIDKLSALSPKRALLVENGTRREVEADSLKVGDLIAVLPGSNIAADGIVVEGQSSVNESMLTGESKPRRKSEGSVVYCGTVNGSGYMTVRVSAVGGENMLSGIIAMTGDAMASKAPIARIADKVAGVCVPAIIGLAFLFGVLQLLVRGDFEFALNTFTSVIVISCPCALGLATPLAVMVGSGKGAENGILIRGGEALETLGKVDTVVLDKTGTITTGITKVGKYYGDESALTLAAAVESGSEHHLAKAILEYVGTTDAVADNVAAVVGKGITATVQGKSVAVGNIKLMQETGAYSDRFAEQELELADMAMTTAYVSVDGKLCGLFGITDEPKEDAAETIAALRRDGKRVIMLTGDNERAARSIARQVGIDEIICDVLPSGKQRVVEELHSKGSKVCFVGDGINDAPALAAADVGMAIGVGTDVAISTADVVLVKDHLTDIPRAIALSRATMRNIRENLFWALIYNLVAIPLAGGVYYAWLGWRMTPMWASACMSVSSLLVVGNALRLKLWKYKELKNMFGKKYEVVIAIEGMMCEHCKAHVMQALAPLAQEVNIDLKKGKASLNGVTATDEELTAAIKDAGYKVIDIKRQ